MSKRKENDYDGLLKQKEKLQSKRALYVNDPKVSAIVGASKPIIGSLGKKKRVYA